MNLDTSYPKSKKPVTNGHIHHARIYLNVQNRQIHGDKEIGSWLPKYS